MLDFLHIFSHQTLKASPVTHHSTDVETEPPESRGYLSEICPRECRHSFLGWSDFGVDSEPLIVWRHKDAALLSQRLPGGGDSENAGQNSGFCKRKCPGGAPFQVQKLAEEVWERNVADVTDSQTLITRLQGLMHRCPRLWHGSPGTVPFPRSPAPRGRAPIPEFRLLGSRLCGQSSRWHLGVCPGVTTRSDGNRGRCHLSAVSRDASDPKLRRSGLPKLGSSCR